MSATRPPVGNPKRQATDAVGGFVYQAWLSVDAWLRLAPEETLFLEHAEDFDRANASTVESVQVKRKRGDLSLGRQAARDAVTAYWSLRKDNPDRAVRYRYLTTEARGTERGDPFGGRRGLDVWDQARRSDEALADLRAYLVQQALPDEVLDLLRTGSDEEVRLSLVLPIHWDTDAPKIFDVREVIDRRLVDHGQRQSPSVPPEASMRAASALYARVTERSSEPGPRSLTSAELAVRFERETTERYPGGSDHAAAARAARTPSPGPRAGDPGFLERTAGTGLPVVAARTEAVAAVRDRAERLALSALVGSSGMGKSTLAELAAGLAGGWYRLDLRGLTPGGMARQIDEATLALATLPDGATVLLDDFDVGDGVDRVLPAARRLMAAAALQAAHLVVTSQSPLPARLALLSPCAGEDLNLQVPSLDEAEVREVAEGYGCPPALAGVWTRVLLIKTSGHPLLVAAFAADARARQWPEPALDDVVGEPGPITLVRAEARQKLGAVLWDNERAFDLVRRLSVFALPFTRTQALRLAAEPPPLRMAALDLDALVGPWIEPVGDRYRMSPLIAGLYRDVMVEEDRVALSAVAADALAREAVATRKVETYDLSMMLSQSVLGRNGPAMALAANIAKTAADFARVADHIDWFAVVATGEVMQTLIPLNPAASLTARELQFRVAVEVGRNVEPVLEAWEAEIDALAASGEAVAGHRLMLALSVLFTERAEVSLDRLVWTAAVVLEPSEPPDEDMEDAFDAAVREHGATDRALLHALEASGRRLASVGVTPGFVLTVLAARQPDFARVADFVEAVVTAPAPLSLAAQAAFKSDVSMTESVAARPWMKASDSGVADWTEALAGLDALFGVAERHGLTALAVSAERTRAIVLHEEVGDRTAAEAALDAAAARLGDPPRLREYRGKILRMSGEPGEALAFYETLLPEWEESDPNTSRLYAYHDVVTAAGRVGAWERAAYWAAEAERMAARLTSRSGAYVELCYAVDGAFAAFKAGRACDGIAALRAVVDRLPPPGDPKDRMLHRRVTHLAAWIQSESGGMRTSVPEPSPGMASRLDSDSEDADVPVLDRATLRSVLHESATLAGCSPVEDDTQADDGVSLFSRSVRAYRRMTDAIRTVAADLPDRYMATMAAAEEAVAEHEGRPAALTPPDLTGALAALTYGLVVAIGRPPEALSVVSLWVRRLVELFGTRDEVERWASVAELAEATLRGAGGKVAALTLVFRDTQALPDHRLLAAAALAKASRDPQVRGGALALLVATVAHHPFGPGVGESVASIAGLDVPPGQGVREAARQTVERADLATLRLAPDLVATLRRIAEIGPTWTTAGPPSSQPTAQASGNPG